ncbi:hypothetical protein KQI63_09215 [bacterium]|nr:hypothetical protein [bacterium]
MSWYLARLTWFLAFLFLTAGCGFESREEQESFAVTVDSLDYPFGDSRVTFKLDSLDQSLYQIHIQSDAGDASPPRVLTLPYPVYRLEAGDLDRDGSLDLFVGVFKSCRFDSVARRRLFIYTLERGWLRSKWLGTYLANDLLDFYVEEYPESTRVHTLEMKEDQYYTGTYAWGSFGPELVTYAKGGWNDADVWSSSRDADRCPGYNVQPDRRLRKTREK